MNTQLPSRRRRTWAPAIVSGVLALCLGLAGCSSSANNGKDSGTLTIAIPADLPALDPATSPGGPNWNFHFNVFDGLYNINPDTGEIEPALAETTEVSDDGLTYTFTIREGVKFHDGSTLTAEDVEFSLNRARDPETKSSYGADLGGIIEVVATGDMEVKITLSAADPLFINKLAGTQAMIIPGAEFEKVGAEAFARSPIGTGPFKFESQRPNQDLVMVANPDYWGDNKPGIDRVVFRIVPEASTRVALLKTHEVDMITDVDPNIVKQLDQDGFTTEGVKSGSVLFIVLRQDDERLQDPRVRLAMNYAINKESIVKNLLLGFGEPVGGFVPPDLPGYEKAVAEPFPFDPEKAKQLLTESGVDLSKPFQMDVPTDRWLEARETAQAIVADLGNVGIDVKLNLIDYGAWLDKLGNRTIAELGPQNMTARVRDPLPGMQSVLICDAPYSYWCDKTFTEMVQKASALGGSERVDALAEIAEYAQANPEVVFLWGLENVVAFDDRLNWSPTPASVVLNLRNAKLTN